MPKFLMVRSALFLARVSNHEFVWLILRDAAKRPLLTGERNSVHPGDEVALEEKV
jgi:hypothetical protein